MIPKPEGESGRLNRGGYNLQDALGWNSRQFKKVKVRSLVGNIFGSTNNLGLDFR
jgi:hypothetical protein